MAISAVRCGRHHAAGDQASQWPELYDLARERADHHETASALPLAERGFRETETNPLWHYKFRVLLAELVSSKDWRRALSLVEPAPPSELALGEFAARRKLTQSLAYTYGEQYSEAASFLEEARAMAALGCPELLGKIYFAQGYLADVQGHYEAAEQHYLSALHFVREHNQSALEEDIQLNLGRVLLLQEHYDAALQPLNASLESAEKSHRLLAEERALGNIGWSYLQLGDIDHAIPVLQRAENAAARVPEPYDQESWLTQLGNVYLSRGEYSRSQDYYSKALALAQILKDSDRIVGAFHNLAQLALVTGSSDRAETYNRKAFAAAGLDATDQSDPSLTLTTAEIAKARQHFHDAEILLNAVLRNPKVQTNLRWQAESDLADVDVAQNKFADAECEFDKAVQIVEKTSGDVKQEERRMSILDAWPFYDDYIRFLVDRGKIAKALQIAEFSRARTLAEAFGINAQQRASGVQVPRVQRFLSSQKQIILAYWLSEKQSYLWVITPAAFQIFPLPGKEVIEQAIQDNDRQILSEHSEVDSSSAGHRLYEMLVRPAEKLIHKNARVTIVPHRGLYRLNFETLVVPGPQPHYWIEDVQVDNASSIALLTSSSRRQIEATQGMLLVGAPTEVSKEFVALKHAHEEMQKVEGHFSNPKVISDNSATPSAYRLSNPGRYRMIDFVSHGTASELSPLDSAIILSPDPDGSYKLYAREIKDILLHADLVTISACYGMGAKTYAGEGLVGLSWAFMRAGAHQVVGALWEVDEASSPQLMDDFYADLTHGKSAAEALRDAKLKMLHSTSFYRHPYYWASLQLYTGS
jgi:CHAT domain-containing protein